MARIFQQFILTMLFAVFASQASAMFISPDPMNPTEPGVGTNRYGYSHGDPINMSDPSGLATVYKDQNGDGQNTYYGEIDLGDLGWGDDFSQSGVLPSEWVDINNTASGGGSFTFSGGDPESSYAIDNRSWFSRTFGPKLSFSNPDILEVDPTLNAIWSNKKARSIMYELMKASNYLSRKPLKMTETGGWFTHNTHNGSISFTRATGPATFNSINLPSPPSTRGTVTFAHIHTHPASGLKAFGQGSNAQLFHPSPADIRGADYYGYSGFVVNNRLNVYGYNGQSGF